MKTQTAVSLSQRALALASFGLRWQSAAATPLLERRLTSESGVALRFPPQSKRRGLRRLASTLALLALLALAGLPARAQDNGGLKGALPPPEFYSRHKAALNLTPEQSRSLRAILDALNRDFRAAEADLAAKSRALQSAVADTNAPAADVKRRLRALLEAENRAKEIRFDASLAARRLLTDAQWQQAQSLAATTPARASVRAALQSKLDRVRALAVEVFPDGPPPEFRRRVAELHQTVRSGDTAVADKLFDALIADLEKQRDTARRAPSTK